MYCEVVSYPDSTCLCMFNMPKVFLSCALFAAIMKIASFNIQKFGRSKVSDPEVLNILTEVITSIKANTHISTLENCKGPAGLTPALIKMSDHAVRSRFSK